MMYGFSLTEMMERTYYEGDVYYDNKEYEFEIDAATGQVTDWSEEAMGR